MWTAGENGHEPGGSDPDERAFNETLKRMLETPPKPHDKGRKEESKEKPGKKDSRG